MSEEVAALAQTISVEQPAVLATVVEVSGAPFPKKGTQLVLLDEGQAIGSVGGGRLAAIRQEARETPDLLLDAPHDAPVIRLGEVFAAENLVLCRTGSKDVS
jgi:xanthine/CO dehydrogenase XdhC/CoxF family maturation factor